MGAYDSHKIETWTTPVVDEADQPVRSAAEMKEIFDANSNQIKLAYNTLLDVLSDDKAAYDAWKDGLENLLTPEQAASLAAAILVLQGQFAGITPASIGAQAAMTAGVDYIDPATLSKSGETGVYSGGAVTAQSTPDQTVAVSAGDIITPAGVHRPFNAVAALAATAADATNPRIDIVYVTGAGVVTYLAGTAAATPSQPATPENGTILAAISRAANDNTISTSDITKQRDFISKASDFEDVTSVTESSNAFACDILYKHTKNFSFSITNATGKTVTFANVPYGACDVLLTIKATGTAAVTWTLDGRTLVWPNGAPILTTGYTYLVLLTYIPLLGKWQGFAQAGGAN